MQIETFVFNPIQVNTYILYDHTKECILIDAGNYTADEDHLIQSFISDNNLIVKNVLCTHGHFDHILGCSFFETTYNIGAEVMPMDETFIRNVAEYANFFGIKGVKVPQKLGFLRDQQIIKAGDYELAVIHTPGHSSGGCVFVNYCDKILFSGDTLFRGSIGRTDLPDGNYKVLLQSISQKLFTLDRNFQVFPGHGTSTTIAKEVDSNPFFR